MPESVLEQLARPFPAKYVKDDGRGNAYVPHHIVTQRLIQIFGIPPKIEILRELYDDSGVKLTGVVMRLTVPGFDSVEEAGEADNPQSKTNGARAKDACSDAIKRCAMRLGLGLHLWAQENYFLYEALTREEGDSANTLATASAVVVKPNGSVGGSTSSEIATQDSPEEVEESGGDDTLSDRGEVIQKPSAAPKVPEASSGDVLAILKKAINDGTEVNGRKLTTARAISSAARINVKAGRKTPKGMNSVDDIPTETASELITEYGLNQEALV